ncbi:peptide deformylase [Fusibacter sp. JL216-2]|uniref:peptide deformylase n=1 Tax=Fusibacter sp. JL216-2 TaxID=3071453 RepID=UPI003D34D2AA
MAIRTIRTDDDPVLRKKSREIDTVDPKIQGLIEDMIETMYDADGVGLAAPQVGILKRVVVIDIYDESGVKVLVNPEIIDQEGEQEEVEGCLSLPGKAGVVKRPARVVVKALNEKGQAYTIEGTGLLARALCHEIDHLNGVLFTDKVIEYVEAE